MLKAKARCDHGIHRGLSVFPITSVLTMQSSNTAQQNASVLSPTLSPAAPSMLGSPSQPIISTKSFPTLPDPASVQLVDGFRDSFLMFSQVIHFVASSSRAGSGPGLTRNFRLKNISMRMCHQTSDNYLTNVISFVGPLFSWRLSS